ncbi:hypothetical protein AOLI_G00069680 [Acnodon oligacanthus]
MATWACASHEPPCSSMSICMATPPELLRGRMDIAAGLVIKAVVSPGPLGGMQVTGQNGIGQRRSGWNFGRTEKRLEAENRPNF